MLLAHLILMLAGIYLKALRLYRIDQAVATEATKLHLPMHEVEGRFNRPKAFLRGDSRDHHESHLQLDPASVLPAAGFAAFSIFSTSTGSVVANG
jgi:hypothetical protein